MAISRVSGELAAHLTHAHQWERQRAHRHAQGWSLTAVDDATAG